MTGILHLLGLALYEQTPPGVYSNLVLGTLTVSTLFIAFRNIAAAEREEKSASGDRVRTS